MRECCYGTCDNLRPSGQRIEVAGSTWSPMVLIAPTKDRLCWAYRDWHLAFEIGRWSIVGVYNWFFRIRRLR